MLVPMPDDYPVPVLRKGCAKRSRCPFYTVSLILDFANSTLGRLAAGSPAMTGRDRRLLSLRRPLVLAALFKQNGLSAGASKAV